MDLWPRVHIEVVSRTLPPPKPCNKLWPPVQPLVITPLQAGLAITLRASSDIQHWSTWRRLHQGQARHSHYQRRLAAEPDP